MGTWGTSIGSNDTFCEVYEGFFSFYNRGFEVADITNLLLDNFEDLLVMEPNEFWFALAKAQWECKSLETAVYNKVKEIINNGQDLELWKEREATDEHLMKRKKALEQFLKKISIEKETPKNRKQNKSAKPPLFNKGDCFIFKMNNGRYGGAVVLDEVYKGTMNYNYIARTKINKEDKPNIDDFINAEIIVIPFQNGEEVEDIRTYYPSELKGGLSLIEVIGNLPIKFRRQVGGTWGRCNYKEFVSFTESCLSYFQMGNETKTKAFVSHYIRNR